jgi:predicted negative regulator of RcsB-dependent stress response
MKKVVRKQLKEDEFVSVVKKIIQFAGKRKKELLVGVAAIVLIVVIILGIRLINVQKAKKESSKLTEIFQLSTEILDNPEKLSDLEALAGNGKFARIATIRLASYWYEKEDFAKAETLLLDFPSSNKDLSFYQAQDLLAQVYRKQGKLDEALAIYIKVMEDPGKYSLDVVYSHMAEIYEEMGDSAKALEFYKKLQEEFAQSYYTYDAAAKIRELEEKK